MPGASPSTGGKGSRKIGRLLRKPSHARYNNENRREKNKAKKIAKQKRKEEKKRKKLERRNNSGIE